MWRQWASQALSRGSMWSTVVNSCQPAFYQAAITAAKNFSCLRPLGQNAQLSAGASAVRFQFNEADAERDQARIVAEELNRPAAGVEIFDSNLKARHRDRAAFSAGKDDPLLSVATDRLLDRLEDCKKEFPTAAILGGAAESVMYRLAGGRSGIKHVVVIDSSENMLTRIAQRREEVMSSKEGDEKPWPTLETIRMDGDRMPLKKESVDVVISSLGLHWHNDLPGVLTQSRLALKPDGLFLGSLFGGETLSELRMSCAAAQLERQGGVSAMVSPLAQVRDCGNLLTRAGLALPTVDVDSFCLNYASVTQLIQHLRDMGESNAVINRQQRLKRDTALAAAVMYESIFGAEDGQSIPATFQIMYLTGWSPHESQQKAAPRGSATVSFQDLAKGLGAKPEEAPGDS